jgi:hypothetical protein
MSEELIKFFGGSALFLAAVSWLIRSLITNRLSKDVEDFKSSLRHQSQLELQEAGHLLRISSLEHEHRVAALHEKRAVVIAKLYELLVEFIGAAESYANPAEFSGEPNKDEKAKILGEKASEFRRYFVTNRIYFPKQICNAIDNLWSEAISPVSKFSFWRKQEGAARNVSEAWFEAWDVMSKKVPPLLESIEDEFRSLIGVSVDTKI